MPNGVCGSLRRSRILWACASCQVRLRLAGLYRQSTKSAWAALSSPVAIYSRGVRRSFKLMLAKSCVKWGFQQRHCRLGGGHTWDDLDIQAFTRLPASLGQDFKHHTGHSIVANVTTGDRSDHLSSCG